MSKLPYMRVFVADWQHKTALLSPLARAAHFDLMMTAWTHGRLRDADEILARGARLSPDEWARVKNDVRALWTVSADGYWSLPDLDDERESARKLSETRRAVGALARRGRSKKIAANAMAIGEANACPKSDELPSQLHASSSSSSSPSSTTSNIRPPAPQLQGGGAFSFENEVLSRMGQYGFNRDNETARRLLATVLARGVDQKQFLRRMDEQCPPITTDVRTRQVALRRLIATTAHSRRTGMAEIVATEPDAPEEAEAATASAARAI